MLVAIGYSLPPNSVAEGEIYVRAEPKRIFELLDTPGNHPLWTPWVYSADNQAGLSFETAGATNGTGAKLFWRNEDSDSGNGSTEITSSVPYKFLTGDLLFNKIPAADYKFTVYNNTTNTEAQVVFQYQSIEQGPLSRLIATVFGNPTKQDLDESLIRLKSIAEARSTNN